MDLVYYIGIIIAITPVWLKALVVISFVMLAYVEHKIK